MTEKDIRETLARNIKIFRTVQHISQSELAEKADISIPFLSQIECANKFPSPTILARISDALKVSVSDLFSKKEETKSENYKFFVDAVRSILDGQVKSFELFCRTFFESREN